MTTLRPYGGWDDLRGMQALCSANLLASPGRAAAHPGDIAGWVGWPPHAADDLGGMFLLWEEGDALAGFAAFLPDDGDLSVFVAPASTGTEDAVGFEEEALAWASRGDGAVRWTEFEDEITAVERWRLRGFEPTNERYLNLVRSLDVTDDDPDERVLPVRDPDVEDRARITHAAFESSEPLADYAIDYAGFRTSPAYPDGWDLLLRDTDGRAAACCIAWPDPVSRAGTLEPVATHPDFHRRGFASALLGESFRRLAGAGMTYAIVGVNGNNAGGEALYRSVGFESDRVLRVFERLGS